MEKILIISGNGISNSGGVERVTLYLKTILEKNKFKVEVVTYEIIEKNKFIKMLKFFLGAKYNYIRPIAMSIYIWKNKKSSYIISNGYTNPFYPNDILYIHGNALEYRKKLGKKIFSLEVLYEFFSGHFSKKIISVSKKVEKEWRENYKVKKIFTVINNCVNLHEFYPKEKKEEKVILYCGRLEFGKGLVDLIKLAKELELQKEFKLIIGTNNIKNVEKFNSLKNTEVIVGLKYEEMREFYNKGNILYLPSMYEGFEMVTTEALACGLKVIGNNIGAISELYDKKIPNVYILETKDHFKEIKKIKEKKEEGDYLKNFREMFSIEMYEKNILESLGIKNVEKN